MRRGFTLVELIIVLSLFSTIAALALPNYKKFCGQPILNFSAKAMASEIRKTQGQARSQHKTLAVDLAKLTLPIPITQSKTISFAPSGNPPPGGSGTIIINNQKKVIVSNCGRVRIE